MAIRTRPSPFDGIPSAMLRRFTADEMRRMIEAGILRGDERLQLLGGRVAAAPPPGDGERRLIERLADLLKAVPGADFDVRTHAIVALTAESEPHVDLVVLPRGQDAPLARLAVEASSGDMVRFDRTVKAAVYAIAAVPEYWVIDVDHRCVWVQRSPDRVSGTYRVLITLERGAVLTSDAVPGLSLALAALFD